MMHPGKMTPAEIEGLYGRAMKALCVKEGHGHTTFNKYRRPFSASYISRVRSDILGFLHNNEATEEQIIKHIHRNRSFTHRILIMMLEEGELTRFKHTGQRSASVPYVWRIA